MRNHRTGTGGMTLIELMMVVAIVAIIASVALPSYSAYLRRSQRSDATAALLKVAAAQEKFYIQNNSYATTAQITALGLNKSEHSWYTIAISAPAAPGSLTTGYSASATPVSPGPQVADTDCASFTITETGRKTAQKKDGTANDTACWR